MSSIIFSSTNLFVQLIIKMDQKVVYYKYTTVPVPVLYFIIQSPTKPLQFIVLFIKTNYRYYRRLVQHLSVLKHFLSNLMVRISFLLDILLNLMIY